MDHLSDTRTLFAGLAMQALVSSNTHPDHARIAVEAWNIADRMLDEGLERGTLSMRDPYATYANVEPRTTGSTDTDPAPGPFTHGGDEQAPEGRTQIENVDDLIRAAKPLTPEELNALRSSDADERGAR